MPVSSDLLDCWRTSPAWGHLPMDWVSASAVFVSSPITFFGSSGNRVGDFGGSKGREHAGENFEAKIFLVFQAVCASLKHADLASSPEESHLEALSEPYVTLSRHTAPIRQTLRTLFRASVQTVASFSYR
jgi:hypothetical protein